MRRRASYRNEDGENCIFGRNVGPGEITGPTPSIGELQLPRSLRGQFMLHVFRRDFGVPGLARVCQISAGWFCYLRLTGHTNARVSMMAGGYQQDAQKPIRRGKYSRSHPNNRNLLTSAIRSEYYAKLSRLCGSDVARRLPCPAIERTGHALPVSGASALSVRSSALSPA